MLLISYLYYNSIGLAMQLKIYQRYNVSYRSISIIIDIFITFFKTKSQIFFFEFNDCIFIKI